MEKVQLQPGLTADPTDPDFVHSVTNSYLVLGAAPDRVTASVKMRPFGLDVLGPLVDGGYLDQGAVDAMPTFTLQSTIKEWTGE